MSKNTRSKSSHVLWLTLMILVIIWSFVVCYRSEILGNKGFFQRVKDHSAAQGDEVQSEPEKNKDTIPPVVSASDFVIMVGDSVSYKSYISVSDNEDAAPIIEVSNSDVDLDEPGAYTVRYTVTDHAGNSTVVDVTMTVKGKDEYEMDLYLSEQSQSVLGKILEDDMNDMQKAYAIYHYVKKNIGYSGSSDKSNYKIAAVDGFKQRRGDCFTYFAVSKVLLDAVGIQNVDVVKLRLSKNRPRHYWSLINVGTGWYHFDSTRFASQANLFMVTDEELKNWDNKHYKNAHKFSSDGLPERSTKSIQKMINYSSAKLKAGD